MEQPSELKYFKKMEDISDEEFKQRIQYGMDFKIPHEIRPIPYLGKEDQIVEYSFDELVARCPATGIKDHYRIVVRYIPDKLVPELKSLKLYYWDYEEFKLPISHEHLAAKIYTYLKDILQPKSFYLRLDVAGRGELFTTIRLGDLVLDKFEDRNVKNL